MSESQKKRILWIDIAKGIAILLMVIGHVDNIHPYLKGIIFSFHMPLFMIINGYLIRSYDIKKTFIRSLRTLMLPYFVVCLLQAAISTILAAGSGTELEVLQYRLISMLFGMSKSSTILISVGGVSLIWFLTSLFLARNIYVILRSLLKKTPLWVQYGSVAVVSLLGYVIGKYVAFLPWSLDVAMVSVIFIAAGDILHKKGLIEKRNIPAILICGGIWVAFLLTKQHIELATRNYPFIIGGTVCAVAASICVMKLCRQIEKVSFLTTILTWFGKNSLIILSVHCLEVRFINWREMVFAPLGLSISPALEAVIRLVFISLVTLAFTLIYSAIKKATAQKRQPEKQ